MNPLNGLLNGAIGDLDTLNVTAHRTERAMPCVQE